MNQEKIGNFIRELRKDSNMTQEQLADKLGVTDKSISRWENGNTMPDIYLLQELANILNTTLPELLNGRKMTKEELIAQKETINNLIALESNQQISSNTKAMNLLLFGIPLIVFALVDNNVHFLQYVFTQNANQVVDIALVGSGTLLNILALVKIAKNNKLHKENVKQLTKKK